MRGEIELSSLHFETLTVLQGLLLFACIFVALGFEFVNGFHDTANAVATVIYTNSLKPKYAVALSGFLNFLGVFLGGIAVAMGIVKLLPVELLVSSGQAAGLAMVLALLLAAISWNLGTWYLGLPASSSHTLIGSILGVGIAHSWAQGHLGQGVNWHKAQEIGLALLLSPMFGFLAAGSLLLVLRALVKDRRLYEPPKEGEPPPWFIRAVLVFTCSGVSFAHGSNDGQKGVGIMMLVLIGVVPTGYALDLAATRPDIEHTIAAIDSIEATTRQHEGHEDAGEATEVGAQLEDLRALLRDRSSLEEIPPERRFEARQAILLADKHLDALSESWGSLSETEAAQLSKDRKALRRLTDYAPTWVLVAIALSLGIGTTVGWQRIVKTVGEKIGKTHLSYAQGAAAELVAMSTIGLAGGFGWPVSTTHVLSSGIAGTMVAQGSGLQGNTVRNIALAWILTLPVCMVLAGGLFLLFRAILAATGG
jgi:PiT family inorganic phosphate transporter